MRSCSLVAFSREAEPRTDDVQGTDAENRDRFLLTTVTVYKCSWQWLPGLEQECLLDMIMRMGKQGKSGDGQGDCCFPFLLSHWSLSIARDRSSESLLLIFFSTTLICTVPELTTAHVRSRASNADASQQTGLVRHVGQDVGARGRASECRLLRRDRVRSAGRRAVLSLRGSGRAVDVAVRSAGAACVSEPAV